MHPGVTVENSKSQKDELIVQVRFDLLNTKISAIIALMCQVVILTVCLCRATQLRLCPSLLL